MEEELKQNTQQPKDGQSASPKHMSIRSILGGDILANDFFKRQTRLLILIMILTVLYIDNRYSNQLRLSFFLPFLMCCLKKAALLSGNISCNPLQIVSRFA